jgi:hypothetical protein
MKSYFKLLIFTLSTILSGTIGLAQPINNPDTSFALKKVNVSFMLRGYFYAASSIKDTLAPGGFASSDNIAKQIVNETTQWDKWPGLSLYIDTTAPAKFADGYEGFKVFLINKTGEIKSFPGSDSRLSIIAEVFHNGSWMPVEYLPSSWCGNSYHMVYLKSNEYWEFDVPRYSGKLKTKLRYKLTAGNKEVYYSNEITAFINRKQLTDKQGHNPQGIMDPYKD